MNDYFQYITVFVKHDIIELHNTLQVEKKLITSEDFIQYFNSTHRIDEIQRFSNMTNKTNLDKKVFRDLRDFLVLELTMRDAKRAGVLADLTRKDVMVRSHVIYLL